MRLERPGLASSHPLQPFDGPDPAPAPGELLLRVKACGVCRTDLQICEGDLAARGLPIVPGHQIVGRVEAVGPGVGDWRCVVAIAAPASRGSRRPTEPASTAARRARTCASRPASRGGIATAGTPRTSSSEPTSSRLRLPDAFADLDAAPLLCGGVIGYRALKVSGIPRGGRLGLYGFGASATLAIQIAKHWEMFASSSWHPVGGRAGPRHNPWRRVDGGIRRSSTRAARRRRHLRPRRQRRRGGAEGPRSRRRRRHQRHSPRPRARARLFRLVVGAFPAQRRQLHARGRAGATRPRRHHPDGKTTVALHRLLHLWRTFPGATRPRVAMVVPTEGLARLIQPLLRRSSGSTSRP